MAQTQLQLFGKTHPAKPPADVCQPAASLPAAVSPLATTTLPAPVLTNPARQLTYGGASHWEWPKPECDHDTITVDRIRDDIDGPSHRFIVKRGDTVEVFFSADHIDLGTVAGISHAKREARIMFSGSTSGVWMEVSRLYPTPEDSPRSNASAKKNLARPGNAGLSHTVSKDCSDSSKAAGFFHREAVNEKNQHPKGEHMEQTNNETLQPIATSHIQPVRAATPYTLERWRECRQRLEAGQLTIEELKSEFQELDNSREAFIAHLLKNSNAKGLANLAMQCGSYGARQHTKPENASAVHQSLLTTFALGESIRYSPLSGETYTDAVRKIVYALTAEQLQEFVDSGLYSSIWKLGA